MSVNNTAWRDVYRPTMFREPKVPGNKGTEVVMVDPVPPEPEREPITVTMAAKWADLNTYKVGETVYADTAGFEGGLEETTTYRWRIQTRPTADGSITNGKWTNYTDHAEEVSIVLEEDGQIRFQCQARDTGVEPAEQVNSFASWEDVEELPLPPPLVKGQAPTLTGTPVVGETLTATKGTFSGGEEPVETSNDIQVSDDGISWRDKTAALTYLLKESDVGKFFRSNSIAIDAVEQELWYESEAIGPVLEPPPPPTTIGDITITVNGEAYNWEEPPTLTVLMNDPINIAITISGDADPNYVYTVRDPNAVYDIQPPEPPPPPTDQGNGPSIAYTCLSENLHVISVSLQDNTATDEGEKYPAVQLWAVDAKTWAELQAKES